MERSLESGASIIEICIAILIISLTGIIIMVFTKNTFSSYRDARVTESASIAAEDKLYQLNASAIPQHSGTDTVVIDDQNYIRTWNVEDIGFVNRVIITVRFRTVGGIKEIRLTGAID